MPEVSTSRFAEMLIDGQLRRLAGARADRFAPTLLDVELIGAADRALATRTPLAVVMPVAGPPVSLVLGVAAVLRAVLNRAASDTRVAVCSSRVGDRALYDQLSVRGQRLADLIPRARVGIDGATAVVGAAGSARGRLFLTSSAERALELLPTLEGVVVDADTVAGTPIEAFLPTSRRQAPLLYVTRDPSDRNVAAIRAAGGVVWSFDAPTLGAAARPAGSGAAAGTATLLAGRALLAAAGFSTVAVHVPHAATDLDTALAELWAALGALARVVGQPGNGGGDGAVIGLRWAWAVFNALALLPVTPSRYDRHVGANPYALTLGTAAATARQYAGHASGTMRPAWQAVAGSIRAAVDAAGHTPREAALIDYVADGAAPRGRRAIVVRNRIAAAALRAALRESPATPLGWEDGVDVVGLDQLTRTGHQMVYDELCLAGTLPRAQAALLATPPAARVRVLTCGPAEGGRAVRHAVTARTQFAGLRAETVQVSAPKLGIAPALTVLDEHAADAVSVVEGGCERALTADEQVPDPAAWAPFSVDVLELIATVTGGDDTSAAPRTGSGNDPAAAMEVIVVYVDDAGTGERSALLVAANDLLTRRRGIELRRVAAKALEAGDTVVLVDRDARRELRAEIASRLAEQPAYAALTMLIDLWHERAARAGTVSGLTYREILARMGGTSITSPSTIGSWVNAAVDGPADGADITRFARAVGDDLLAANAQQVVWALRTMHSVDRRLGHWLSSRVDAALASTGDAIVDAELGVHLADLLESVSDHVVVDVDLRPGRWAPASLLGLVVPARHAEDALLPGPAAG
jgi:hypothetical protein